MCVEGEAKQASLLMLYVAKVQCFVGWILDSL